MSFGKRGSFPMGVAAKIPGVGTTVETAVVGPRRGGAIVKTQGIWYL